MAEQIFLESDGNRMECLVAAPEDSGPHPAIVMAPHLPADQGLNEDAFTQGVADRYAAAGYVVVVPQVFHRQPLERPRHRPPHHVSLTHHS